MSVVADAVTAANVIAKLPFFAELDPDAVLTTFREKQLAASSELTAEGLQALFYALGFDKRPKGAKAAAEVVADGEDAPAVEGEDGEAAVEADADAGADADAAGETPTDAAESTAAAETAAEAPAETSAEAPVEAPAVDGDAAVPAAEGDAAATDAGASDAVAPVEAEEAAADATDGAAASESAAAPVDAPPVVAAPPAPPAPPTNASIVWNAVVGANAASVDGAVLISKLALLKSGFGDAALRFAVKAQDHAGAGCLTEAALWRALTLAANAPLTGAHRTHLRKVWRGAEKYQKPEEEAPAEEEAPPAEGEAEAPAEDGGEDGGDAAAAPAAPPAPVEPAPPAAPAPPEETKVMTDAFLTALTEDEVLAALFARDVAVPIEAPPEAEEGGEE